MLTAAPPPLPGARRPADAARGLRRARRACGSPTSATATTSPARSRVLGTLAGVDVAVASPAGLRARGRPRAARRRDRARDAARGSRARRSPAPRAVYTDVWVSMGDEETADERRARARRLPRRRRAARRRRAGRVRDARPARPPRRGDHRRGPLRRAPAHLGPGREPPPRAEGAAGAAGRRTSQAAAVSERAPTPAAPARSAATSSSSRSTRSPSAARASRGSATSGYVVFVAGAIPGDRVRAVVHKRKRSYAHARTLEVLDARAPSGSRRAADHPGVPWQVLPYERQLEIKRAQVDEALRRIGRPRGLRARADRARASSSGATATSSSTPSATATTGRAGVRLPRARRRAQR